MQNTKNSAGPRRRQQGRALPWLAATVLVLAAGSLWWWQTQGSAPGVVAATRQAASAPGAAGSGSRRLAGASQAQPVSVAEVRRQDLRPSIHAIGRMAASNTAVVRTQVSGVLQALNFQEGQQVQAGQLLAQLDARPFQAMLGQAKGVLARDKALLDGARMDLARYRALLAKDAVPKQQLDTQAALVAQLEGTVKADAGAVDSARVQLSYSRITAPIPGRVGLKQIGLGNVASPGDANGIVSITQTRPIALVFAVPAADVQQIMARLRANAAIPVQAWDRSGNKQLAEGRVAAVDNAIDASTDTIKVKALFANADDALFPNQAVSVTLQLDTLAKVLSVPQAAVRRGAQGCYVYLVKLDDSVTARPVTPGAVDAGWMAVDGQLQAGDRVVIDGADRLREGAKVEIIAADPTQPTQRARASAPAGDGSCGVRAAAPAAAGPAAASSEAAADAARVNPPAGARARPGAGVSSASAPAPTATTGIHPRWMDRVPPEQAARVRAMSPGERRAWFKEQAEIHNLDPTR